MRIIINGIKKEVKGTLLKDALEDNGYVFPCGGVGKCGKCRINAPLLEPTTLDRRFLSDVLIGQGVRLACDKKLIDNLEVSYSAQVKTTVQTRKLEECRIGVRLSYTTVSVSIIEYETVETVYAPMPFEGGLSRLKEDYERDRESYSKKIRAIIGKESVELFEKFGCAKADTLAVGGSGTLIKMLLGLPLNEELTDIAFEDSKLALPSDSVYFLPTLNDCIGGDFLADMVELPTRTLLLDCEEVLSMALIGDSVDKVTAMWDVTYNGLECMSIIAGIKMLTADINYTPNVCVTGKFADKVKPLLEGLNMVVYTKPRNGEGVTQACLSNRFRAKINKQKGRCVYIDLLLSEDFQDCLNELSKGSY